MKKRYNYKKFKKQDKTHSSSKDHIAQKTYHNRQKQEKKKKGYDNQNLKQLKKSHDA